ncbi:MULTISPECIES: sulfite exporter TauE/SafE family protein [Ralstonia]|uniref:sulfite exporter TauE/SafE family protein n=1 Tax=Ralstonia TaxID=48736 RepID=UPI000DD4D30E|nr:MULTISPECIES: sulfite exporter TauE/SafE family protein [unclassified Ralstonia]CAJ0702232.1 hypothetical protein R11007_03759 [Ralstonia sp. LMG 32967]
MSPMEAGWIISAGLGSVVGLILALTGAGGAIVAVPLLIFGLHLSVPQAAPIALLAVGLSAGLGAMLGLREGKVRYKAAGLMALCGVVISPFGIWVAHRVPNTPLTLLFAVVLAYVALRMFRQARAAPSTEPQPRRTAPPCHLDTTTAKLVWTLPCARALAASGVGAGFLSGLLGVGGGFVIVPALRRATDLPMQTIVATSLAVIALVSMGGVVASAIGGHVDWHIALPFAAGALTGMLAGRRFARHLAGPALQQGFAAFAGVVALGMIARTLI